MLFHRYGTQQIKIGLEVALVIFYFLIKHRKMKNNHDVVVVNVVGVLLQILYKVTE